MRVTSSFPWPAIALGLFMAGCGYVLFKIYCVRSRVNRLRQMHLPMPQWSWFTGHLWILRQYLLKFPSDTFINVVITELARDMGNVDMFYLDLWPFLAPTLFVCNSDAAYQVSNRINLPKPHLYKEMFEPMNGGPNLLTMNGTLWKYWRSLFNAGFAPGYLMQQVIPIIENVETFCDRLHELQGTVFCLEDVTTPLTMDIIMKVALDLELDYQRSAHPLADSLLRMIAWSSLGSPWAKYNPIRTFILKKHGSIMNRIIRRELEKRFEEYHSDMRHRPDSSKRKSKSIVSLTLEEYAKENHHSKPDESKLPKLDDQFAAFATHQLRLFLFAGHDTVTSVLVYIYHMLHEHPEVLSRICDEHSAVFGPEVTQASSRMRGNPTLINQTPFTLAVIKETMRLYPPAGAIREGSSTQALLDRSGRQYPTKDCLISLSHHSIHRNPNTWIRAEEFVPERWLVEPGHELYPPVDAFRPFELGPRMCIGHNLSLIELKVTLVMTVRAFAITPAYQQWNDMKREGPLEVLRRVLGLRKQSECSKGSDSAYQAEKGGAHPAQGYPCTVKSRLPAQATVE